MGQFGALLWALLMAGSASTRAAISDQESQDKAVAAVAAINGTVQAPGLRTGVRVQLDRWGVAHIYAKNQHDLFFAQGFNAAHERLFQLEVWRRRVTGTMAEIQGLKALDRDLGARLLRLQLDLVKELNFYHPAGAQIITAFVEGIDAYIVYIEQH